MRPCLARVWALCASRKLFHGPGPRHNNERDSKGEIPCMAATARATAHSKRQTNLERAVSLGLREFAARVSSVTFAQTSPMQFSGRRDRWLRAGRRCAHRRLRDRRGLP